MEMKQKIKEFLQGVIDNEDHESTWFLDLETHNGKRWALVAAWMDYNNINNWEVYAKLAYQPTNSLMQEYDFDWLMPIDKAGDVDDTELTVGSEPDDLDIIWWIKNWERFKKEYVHPMGTNIYFTNLSTLKEDETQFDTTDKKELAELWWDFCMENGMIATEEVEIDE